MAVDEYEEGSRYMVSATTDTLATLYEKDETAWLERMALLVRQERWDELDSENLSEFLTDMARRDKREVESRLAVLLAHVLKWVFQPGQRTGSWRATMEVQRHELELLLQSRVLYNHAEMELANAYAAGLRQAGAETGMPTESFPPTCPYTVDQLVSLEDLKN
jgi:uncharacterized protein YaaW (UPF0174 family)